MLNIKTNFKIKILFTGISILRQIKIKICSTLLNSNTTEAVRATAFAALSLLLFVYFFFFLKLSFQAKLSVKFYSLDIPLFCLIKVLLNLQLFFSI